MVLAYPKLVANLLAGTLPPEWGNPGAFPALATLSLYNMALTGLLPSAWGQNSSFPSLSRLFIGSDNSETSQLTGTLPSEWGNAAAFQKLGTLQIGNTSMSGKDIAILQSISHNRSESANSKQVARMGRCSSFSETDHFADWQHQHVR